MITWIKGQNACGKTIRIKQMLGAKIEADNSSPMLDIEMPRHIALNTKASQVRIFIQKEKSTWKEYNKLLRLYERYCLQEKVLHEKETHIQTLQTRLAKIKEDNARIASQHNERINFWKSLIVEEKALQKEQDAIEANPIYQTFHELLTVWCETKTQESRTALMDYEKTHTEAIEPLNKRWDEILEVKNTKFWRYGNLEGELEKEKRDAPQSFSTWHEEDGLERLRKDLERFKRTLVRQSDIIALIGAYNSKKTVWIDGRPSSDFTDFYDMVLRIKKLSPEALYISHCGNEVWFRALPKTRYVHTGTGREVSLDLQKQFDSVFIEVPSMDNKVVLVQEGAMV